MISIEILKVILSYIQHQEKRFHISIISNLNILCPLYFLNHHNFRSSSIRNLNGNPVKNFSNAGNLGYFRNFRVSKTFDREIIWAKSQGSAHFKI